MTYYVTRTRRDDATPLVVYHTDDRGKAIDMAVTLAHDQGEPQTPETRQEIENRGYYAGPRWTVAWGGSNSI
jgi:hypothetical protein